MYVKKEITTSSFLTLFTLGEVHLDQFLIKCINRKQGRNRQHMHEVELVLRFQHHL